MKTKKEMLNEIAKIREVKEELNNSFIKLVNNKNPYKINYYGIHHHFLKKYLIFNINAFEISVISEFLKQVSNVPTDLLIHLINRTNDSIFLYELAKQVYKDDLDLIIFRLYNLGDGEILYKIVSDVKKASPRIIAWYLNDLKDYKHLYLLALHNNKAPIDYIAWGISKSDDKDLINDFKENITSNSLLVLKDGLRRITIVENIKKENEQIILEKINKAEDEETIVSFVLGLNDNNLIKFYLENSNQPELNIVAQHLCKNKEYDFIVNYFGLHYPNILPNEMTKVICNSMDACLIYKYAFINKNASLDILYSGIKKTLNYYYISLFNEQFMKMNSDIALTEYSLNKTLDSRLSYLETLINEDDELSHLKLKIYFDYLINLHLKTFDEAQMLDEQFVIKKKVIKRKQLLL